MHSSRGWSPGTWKSVERGLTVLFYRACEAGERSTAGLYCSILPTARPGRLLTRRSTCGIPDGFAALGLAALGIVVDAGTAAQPRRPQPEKNNMELVGYHDLQGRSAYQPLVHKQGERWIAYVGHHGDFLPNPLTGKQEHNGTSILDVTDPRRP
jgi:hypothetical protein